MNENITISNSPKEPTQFKDLKRGQPFLYCGILYIKMEENTTWEYTQNTVKVNSLELLHKDNARLVRLNYSDEVEPVSIKIIINRLT